MFHGRMRAIAKQVRSLIQAGLLSSPGNVQCNVCGWTGRRFVSDKWHSSSTCPKCRSDFRQRLFFAAFQHREDLSLHKLAQDRRILHIAPEKTFHRVFIGCAASYTTADFLRADCDLKLDMSNMAGVRDGSYDLVLAFDVLEHVPDFRRAIAETHRILAERGRAVITVPQKQGLTDTYEDPSIVTAAERLRHFGQEDHLRIFGDNFPALLEMQGFDVTIIDASSFSGDLVLRHVLFPPFLSLDPLATNYRKIFFCTKR